MIVRWFRFYTDAIRHPKVATLSDGDYRLWTELLAVAADNDGVIPSLEALKSLLKRRSDHLKAGVNRLVKAGLINASDDGFYPHNWRKRQYKSDTSTDRVKRFRSASRNVSETPPETETETEETLAKANDADASPEKQFWQQAVGYLGEAKRPLVGRWCRDFGQAETAKAITVAQVERAVDPIAYIERTLRGARKSSEAAKAGEIW